MEKIKDININEAIAHVLDSNADNPILNEYPLQLTDEVYNFLFKHIQSTLKNNQIKYALFKDEEAPVKSASQEYLNGIKNLTHTSKVIAENLFSLIKSDCNISSCDLIVLGLSTDLGPMLGILIMDYDKNFAHNIDFLDEKISVGIVSISNLPRKLRKCAFIKPIRSNQQFNLTILDKQKKIKQEYGQNWFSDKYLGCNVIENERDMTEKLLKETETWTRNMFTENAEVAEKVRSSIRKELKENEVIDVEKLSNMFKDEDVRESFRSYLDSKEINEINVDKEFIEKKLQKIRLKIDSDIDLCISQDAYTDKDRFEVECVGDGRINIVIKNVMSYIEK